MNLRGAVVPVIDLSARLGHGEAQVGRRSCIVVVEAAAPTAWMATRRRAVRHGLVVGLLVDAVYEVFDTDSTQVEPVPALGTRMRPDYLGGMTRARGEVIGVLALDRVLAQADLASAIAGHTPIDH
jgi:purine-binding chemotaxis protein CheW